MGADASQGWSDVSNGFWGSDLNNNSHSGGRDIINAAEALYDQANNDMQQANRANSLLKKGQIAEAQAKWFQFSNSYQPVKFAIPYQLGIKGFVNKYLIPVVGGIAVTHQGFNFLRGEFAVKSAIAVL